MVATWIDVGADLLNSMLASLPFASMRADKSTFTPEQVQLLKVAFAEAFAAFAKLVDTRISDLEAKLAAYEMHVATTNDATASQAATSLEQWDLSFQRNSECEAAIVDAKSDERPATKQSNRTRGRRNRRKRQIQSLRLTRDIRVPIRLYDALFESGIAKIDIGSASDANSLDGMKVESSSDYGVENEPASIGSARRISIIPSQPSHVDYVDQCLLFTYGSESDTMSGAFTCKIAATALTYMSLTFRGVPCLMIARIRFPYLPGPPRSAVHSSLISDVDIVPSPSSSELAFSYLPSSLCSLLPSSPPLTVSSFVT